MENKLEKLNKLNKIGKIDNRLISPNFASFSKSWTAVDLDWWYILASQAVDKGNSIIKIPVRLVKNLLLRNKNTHESMKDFIRRSNHSLSKFLDIKITFEQENKKRLSMLTTHMFDVSYIDSDLNVLLKIKPAAEPVFNQLTSWTRFALESFTSLHTTYSKRLFIYLKQWRTIGKVSFKLKDFRDKLDVPKSYKSGSIDQKILYPALEDLAPYFMKLKLTKDYARAKRGRKLSGYTFTFKPETKAQLDIRPSLELEEVTAIYSIMSNPYLSLDHRFRAVDRYRGLRLGTTKKNYQSAHPQTFFVDSTSEKNGSVSHRYDQTTLNKQTITTLKTIAEIYERLLKQGKLKEWDLYDLQLIESILFKKEASLGEKTKKKEHPYKPGNKLIAEYILHKLPVWGDYSKKNVELDIKNMIQANFGVFVQMEDKRPQEIKGNYTASV